jgi:hypothetical protein
MPSGDAGEPIKESAAPEAFIMTRVRADTAGHG